MVEKMTTKWIIASVATLAIVAVLADIGMLYQQSHRQVAVASPTPLSQVSLTPAATTTVAASPTPTSTQAPHSASTATNASPNLASLQAIDQSLASFDTQTQKVDSSMNDQQSDLSE